MTQKITRKISREREKEKEEESKKFKSTGMQWTLKAN